MRLSKSQYCRGQQCEKSLWLFRHERALAAPPSAMAQMIFDQGTAVGELACRLFPGGTLISEDHTQPMEAVQATEREVNAGAQTLYEAAAIYDEVLIRADILTRNAQGSWDLIEVKSSSSVSEIYLHDIAIQRYVLEGAGYPIGKTLLMHINKKYTRRGALNVEGLFSLVDVTADVTPLMDAVNDTVHAFHKLLAQTERPTRGIGRHCKHPHPCDFMDTCWAHIPPESVFDIGSIHTANAVALWESGVRNLVDIPEDYRLSKKQRKQVNVTKSGVAHINGPKVASHLAYLTYPLYFLDFETVNPAIPPFEGLGPFQNLPFQASVHIQQEPDGPLEHKELLAEPDADPRRAMTDFLCQAIGPTGSVIAYNASFEGGCLESLEGFSPSNSQALASIRNRLWDLAVPFRKGHYLHPAFRGSWSLKRVLPALVPSMTYEGMAIADGGKASALYFDAMRGALVGEEKDAVFAALRQYCAQDTLATVEVLRVLRVAV